ncbi:MAG TPA: NAD(P)H-hydrate dehydratase [Candidatus Binatia bacterium]|nr:NAD(P)H-hydrate dehydratase [Candidatus Binatia bacterium]
MYVLTAEEMRRADAAAVERHGEVALMRAAGAAIARVVPNYARGRRIVAFAGTGNNGGDAFAALAELDSSYERTIYADQSGARSAARADAESRARAAGVRIEQLPDPETLAHRCSNADVILDGVLGVGARLPVREPYATIVRAIDASSARVIAIDIPTGIDPTTGRTGDPVIAATATVTLGAPKMGLFLDPARLCAGDLWFAPIGFDATVVAPHAGRFRALDDREFTTLLPQRPAVSEKRSAGAPLIVAGSVQFPGAAVLCARGAARAGAGYVTVAAPRSAAKTLRNHLIEQVVVAYNDDKPARAIEQIMDVTRNCSSIGIGPGLGLAPEMGEIVRGLLAATDLPVVADASALFHLGKYLELLRGKRVVLTPHAGEFARLSGKGTVKEEERVERLRAFVAQYGITTLLKGHVTLIDDGTVTHVNTSGDPALATAGTGDVLTGMIATLLSQGLAPVDAARAAAFWHGRGGSVARKHRPIGVVAGDIPDVLGAALMESESVRETDGLLRIY